jgi:hypothetical protein
LLYRFDPQSYERLFNWAEARFPSVFGPPAASQDFGDLRSRAYANAIFLGVMNGEVYLYGPPWGGLLDVGRFLDILPFAIQDGY